MCLPKVSRGSLLANGRGRGDSERLAESKRRQRGDRNARAVAKIRRTAGTYPKEHRGRERSGERLRVKQRHRFSRFTGETRRSEHQVCFTTARIYICASLASSRQNSSHTCVHTVHFQTAEKLVFMKAFKVYLESTFYYYDCIFKFLSNNIKHFCKNIYVKINRSFLRLSRNLKNVDTYK